jgi:hypothetical protein
MTNAVLTIVTLLMSTLAVACAGTPEKASQTEAVEDLNLQMGVALRGYDAVGYFTENGAVMGDPDISYQWQGAIWQFSSVEHRTQFAAAPAQYAPQFGGYCAFAVAQGTTADGDPQQWAIVKDKLYVNNNAVAKKLWDQDRHGNIVSADRNWPLIPKKPPSIDKPAVATAPALPAEAAK